MMTDRNPVLDKIVESKDSRLKEIIVEFVGETTLPENNEVTVEHIVEVFSKQFPEFLLAVAEENFIRGYSQALVDKESMMEYNKS
tara:strand:+ start:352 stop:606 length:255 start_codon:yes stop_codon:yes gene_type:complete